MNFLSLFGQTSDGYDTYESDLFSNESMYDTSLYDTTSTQLSPEAATGIAIGFIIFGIIAFLVSYAVSAFLLSRIFKKAGVEPWKAWVPVYNNWVMLEIGGQKGFWAVIALIPFVGIISIVFMYIAMYNIGLKLGKESWFVLLAIFLPLVWLIWLAFDKSTWNSTAAPAAAPSVPPQTPAGPSSTPPAPTPSA